MVTIMTQPVRTKKKVQEQARWFAKTFGVKFGMMNTKAGWVVYRGGPKIGRKYPREPIFD